MAKKRTNEEFVSLLKEISPTIELLTPYDGKDKEVTAQCKKCSYVWNVVANSLIRGLGCPKCAGNAPKTTDQFILELKNKNNDITVLGEYKGANTKIAVACKKCGKEWLVTPSKLLNGRGCPTCAKVIVTQKRIHAFIEKRGSLKENYPDLITEWNYEENKIRGLYIDELTPKSNKYASWICSNCGHIYDALISNRTSVGSGCPVCSGSTVVKGKNDLTTVAAHLMDEWDYEQNEASGIYPEQLSKGSEIEAYWKCVECGRKWKARIYSRIAGCGCPHCAEELQTSFPEKALYYYMRQLELEVINTYKPDWIKPSELDIFIPELNLGIEYDGEVYHKDAKKDEAKDILCAQHGITVLHIREPKCPELSKDALVYKRPNKKIAQLDEMITSVIGIINHACGTNFKIHPSIIEDKPRILALLLKKEKENSIANIPEAMLDWDWAKNEGIDPEKIARGSNFKVWWKCHVCGASSYLRVADHQGHKCTVCGNVSPDSVYYEKIIKTGKKDFKTLCPELCKDWIPELNDGLNPENFSYKSSKRIIWKCHVCGHVWGNEIYNRTNGQRCPACARKKEQK